VLFLSFKFKLECGYFLQIYPLLKPLLVLDFTLLMGKMTAFHPKKLFIARKAQDVTQ
jgi:hypothetical protein